MKINAIIIFLVLTLAGCSTTTIQKSNYSTTSLPTAKRSEHVDPELHLVGDLAEAIQLANNRAHSIKGRLFVMEGSGSMEPVLKEGDIGVIDTHQALSKKLFNHIVAYHSDAKPLDYGLTTHRLMALKLGGYEAEGDAIWPEYKKDDWRSSFLLVTPKNYVGVVTDVYRLKGEKVP